MYFLNSRFRLLSLHLPLRLALLLVLCFAASCKHGNLLSGEIMYVSAPQANLRDHVATVYNRVGSVTNGDRLEVLERQRHFVRVRTSQKVEGWIELRALVPSETYDRFQQLAKDNRAAPIEGRGVTRVELNMHVAPGRETDTLYQLAENSKVEMIKRSTTERATPEEIAAKRTASLAKAAGEQAKLTPKRSAKASTQAAQTRALAPTPTAASKTATTAAANPNPAAIQQAQQATTQSATQSASQRTASSGADEEAKPKPMDDWWLVRDQRGHAGWVLARMVDLDLPMDVVQYAEGQRIQAAFLLNTVQDEVKGAIPQYLVLLNANKDGIPYDFNQIRVFTWNLKKHRYETGYREHFIIGYFPVKVSNENFGKEGSMPVFAVRKQNVDGSITERKYRVIGNIVRQVLAPGEQLQPAAHSPDEPKKKNALQAKKTAHVKSIQSSLPGGKKQR